jgi:hypothetical protein
MMPPRLPSRRESGRLVAGLVALLRRGEVITGAPCFGRAAAYAARLTMQEFSGFKDVSSVSGEIDEASA